jgi:plastocyanin
MAILVVLLCMLLASCGGGGSSTSPTPVSPTTFRISSSGIISPVEMTVAPGTRVLFINDHSRRHDMSSDPHPDHTDCPEINQVGSLNTGQSRETGNLVAVRTCGFHDHQDPDNASLRGRIVIR